MVQHLHHHATTERLGYPVLRLPSITWIFRMNRLKHSKWWAKVRYVSPVNDKQTGSHLDKPLHRTNTRVDSPRIELRATDVTTRCPITWHTMWLSRAKEQYCDHLNRARQRSRAAKAAYRFFLLFHSGRHLRNRPVDDIVVVQIGNLIAPVYREWLRGI